MNRLAILMLTILWSQSSFALTLKSGQVIGQDGNVYDGASPEMKEAIINRGDVAGISGSNIYVIIQGEVAFIPIPHLTRGKLLKGFGDNCSLFSLCLPLITNTIKPIT